MEKLERYRTTTGFLNEGSKKYFLTVDWIRTTCNGIHICLRHMHVTYLEHKASQDISCTIQCVRKVAVRFGYGRVQLKCDGTR